ncbi:hypothetical protein C8J57DRAFT_1320897 [Mycena rebaudengoi]|nr:hypothetical protein C8J57DRAFT_1320897 [Mycena rebaudengoi]
MLDMDVDAFFREQDERMNEPEDDMEEFITRLATTRRYKAFYPELGNSLDSMDLKTPPKAGFKMQFAVSMSKEPSFWSTPMIPGRPDDSPNTVSYPDLGSSLKWTRSKIPLSVGPEMDDSHMRPTSPTGRGVSSNLIAGEDAMDVEPVALSRPPVSPIRLRTSPRQSGIPRTSPATFSAEPSLKRKESPVKSQQPPRKKPATEQPPMEVTSVVKPSSRKSKSKQSPVEPQQPSLKKFAIHPPPAEVTTVKPPSRKLKSKEAPVEPQQPPRKKPATEPPPVEVTSVVKQPSRKLISRPTVKVPHPVVPETIDLSLSPIEDANFSVLVSRFEPEATSTQPLAAEPSLFLQMQQRVEKRNRENKLRKKTLKRVPVAGPSKAGPSNNDASSGDELSSIISVSSRAPSPENRIIPITKTKLKQKEKEKPEPKPVKKAPQKKGKKEKIRMTPREYAQMIKDKYNAPTEPGERRPVVDMFLKGKNIFYTGGDLSVASETTRDHMNLLVKHGANLFPVFDAERVDYIVTDAQLGPTLRALGVRTLRDIPSHIAAVKWKWIGSGFKPFPERVPQYELRDDNGNTIPRASLAQKTMGDVSHISDFTQDKIQPRRSVHDSDSEDEERNEKPVARSKAPQMGEASSSARKYDPSDPLAEFYAQARADRDNAWSRHGEVDDDETDLSDSDNEAPPPAPGSAPKRGFTCDSRQAQPRKNGPNEFIAKKLEELMLLHKAKPSEDDHWRAFTYNKCLRTIRSHPKPIQTLAEALSIRHVGVKTAKKIMEIVNTGDLGRIKYENTEDVKATKLFQGIYGVGQKTAFQWYAAGCRTLEDIKAGKGGVKLTPAQSVGIEFYDDINDRMPRQEAKGLFDLIKPVALAIDPELEIHIMGSYRRGKADCGDIDIMITRCPEDGRTHAGILHHLILRFPTMPSTKKAIYRGLCRLPRFGSRRRRIDFLTVPWTSRGAALLYYTGDDIFNRAMRYKANRLGYSLNQRGLYAGVVRSVAKWSVKTNQGNIVASETEEEIFRMLVGSVPEAS